MSTCSKARPRVILVNTNVLVAAARTADTHHVTAARLLRETDDRFLVAPTVLAETCYLLHEFGGPAPEMAFLRSVAAGELELVVLTVADTARMAELAERYADLGLGGTDASLVALAERLGLTTLATFDRRHFTVVRPAHTPGFTLLSAWPRAGVHLASGVALANSLESAACKPRTAVRRAGISG